MSLLFTIAKNEMRDLTREGIFRVSAALFALALLAGLLAGATHYRRVQTVVDQAVERERVRWLNQPARDPHSATHFGQTAFHANAPLTALDTGVNPFAGSAIFLESHKRTFPRFAWVADAAQMPLLGHFSAATVLRLFLPLLVILLAHAAFSREREAGRYGLIAASGVSSKTYVGGKFVGVAALLAMVLVPAVLLLAATVFAVSRESTSANLVWRIALFSLSYGLYTLVFLSLALAVSACVATPATGRIILVSFWVLSTIAAPRAITDVAYWRNPTPRVMEFDQSIAEDPNRYLGAKRYEAFKQEVLKQYGVSKTEDLPVNYSGLLALYAEEHTDQLIDRHFKALDASYEKNARWVSAMSWLSPTLAMDQVSMSLAGSDLAHYLHFLNSAEAHRRVMVQMLNEEQRDHPRKAGEKAFRADAAVWQKIPTYRYQTPSVSWAIKQQAVALAAFGGWILFALFCLWFAVRQVQREPLIQ